MGWDRRLTALAAAGLLACSGSDDDRTWIAPLDGQSAVQSTVELTVSSPDLSIPADYPVPDMIRVVDLDAGGEVPGFFTTEKGQIRFIPEGGWAANRTYAWTIDLADNVPHGPDLSVPDSVLGTGVFRTNNTLHMLGASVDTTGKPCLVFSRKLAPEDIGELQVTVDDIPLVDETLVMVPEEGQGEPYDLHPDDLGVDAACIDTNNFIVPTSIIRVWLGDYGPWRAKLRGGSVEDLIAHLRWGGDP